MSSNSYQAVKAAYPAVQCAGGKLMLHIDGKHIDFGTLQSDGLCQLTDTGKALMESQKEVEKPKRARRVADAAVLEVVDE